jgi:hypothetical protein
MDPQEIQNLIAETIAASLNEVIPEIVTAVRASLIQEEALGNQPDDSGGNNEAESSGQSSSEMSTSLDNEKSFSLKLEGEFKILPKMFVTEVDVKTAKTKAWKRLKKTGKEHQLGTIFFPSPQDKREKEVAQSLLPLLVWRRVVTEKSSMDKEDFVECLKIIDFLETYWRHEFNLSFTSIPPGSKTKLTREESKTILITNKGDPHAAQMGASSMLDRRTQTMSTQAMVEAIRKQRQPIIIDRVAETSQDTTHAGRGGRGGRGGAGRGSGRGGSQVGSDDRNQSPGSEGH